MTPLDWSIPLSQSHRSASAPLSAFAGRARAPHPWRIGWTYVGAMVVVNATALAIYRLTGSFGPFRILAGAERRQRHRFVMPAVRRKPAVI